MKYSIGYQLPDEFDSTYNLCRDFKDNISNVYFSWGNQPGGRMPLCSDDPKSVEEVTEHQLEELKCIGDLGISLTLLLNANCYGEGGASEEFAEEILRLVGYLKQELNICSVTTASPFVAKIIKKAFGDSIKVVSSVNMRVDCEAAMEQLGMFFDGFYLRKEYNRNIGVINRLKKWCDSNSKTLHILANSGCINYCGFQTYHDNLVAHHKFLQKQSITEYPSFCWEYLHGLCEDDALSKILASNFIRPEDVRCYETIFREMKLATRMHSSPRRVLSAYVRGSFAGNLLDITEPSYSPLFKGVVLDNRLIPEGWFDITGSCDKKCFECGYCRKVAEKIKIKF